MSKDRCPRCGATARADLVERLAYRMGQMQGNGFPWQKGDVELFREAIIEIQWLRHNKSLSEQIS